MVKVGIGIIGTGSIAKTYTKCIAELEQVYLVAMYTKSDIRITEAEQLFGVPVFSNMKAFLAEATIDLVCICNESGNHGEAIQQAALANKHVLCEKPLEVTPEKVDDAIQICKAQNVLLGGVFQNRCEPAYQAVLKAVSEGSLGTLLMGNAYINWYRNTAYYKTNPWRGTLQLDGGAAFMNQGIHTIDLLLTIMGPVHSVFGNIKTLVHAIQGEDVGAGLITFKNGAIGSITAGTSLYPGYPERLEIYGEKGSIRMEGGTIIDWNVADVAAPDFNREAKSGAADPTSIGHLNHKMVLQDMVDAIFEKRRPMVDGKEARKSVALITALYRSSQQRKEIIV